MHGFSWTLAALCAGRAAGAEPEYGGLVVPPAEELHGSAASVGGGTPLLLSGRLAAAAGNPALLASIPGASVSFATANLATYANALDLAGAFPARIVTAGLRVTSLVADRWFPGRLAHGTEGFVGAKSVVALPVALPLDRAWSLGIAPKAIVTTDADLRSVLALSGDVGVAYRHGDSWTASFAAESFPPVRLSYLAQRDDYPGRVRFGAVVAPEEAPLGLRVAVEAAFEPSEARAARVSAGAEAAWGPLRARAGFSRRDARGDPWKARSSFSFGAGLASRSAIMDIALLSTSDRAGVSAWISFEMSLGTAPPPPPVATVASNTAAVLGEAEQAARDADFGVSLRLARRAMAEASDPGEVERAYAAATAAREAWEREMAEVLQGVRAALERGSFAAAFLSLLSVAVRGFDHAPADQAHRAVSAWIEAEKRHGRARAAEALEQAKPLDAALAAQSVLALDPDDVRAKEALSEARRMLSGAAAAAAHRRNAQGAGAGRAEADARFGKATRLFEAQRFAECLRELQLLLAEDPLHAGALSLYERVSDRLDVR